MDEQKIRAIVQQEIERSRQSERFSLSSIPRHTHNGLDSPPINQKDVIPGLRAEGSITFSRAIVYKIGITFNPSAIWVHGNVTGALGEKFIIVGNAQLGSSFYLQPSSSNSVVTGGPLQKLIQSTSYFGRDSSGNFHTLVDEGHIVDVFYTSVHARATVTSFDSSTIEITVSNLDAGWNINLSWTVT